MALNKDRNTKRRDGSLLSDPVAAAAILYVGAMYALNAAGDAVPAGTAGAGTVRGVVRERADNTGGAAGAIRVEGQTGVHQFANSAAADLITRADIGKKCYVVDDETVAKTDNAAARKAAGTIVDVDAAGVWVDVGAPSIA